MVRVKGDYEQWLTFFLEGVIETADSAIETSRRILELQTSHRQLLWQKKISSPYAVGILESLYSKPYVSVTEIAKEFSISYQAASKLVSQLEGAGILKEITHKKRGRRYLYIDYINILAEGTRV